MKQTLYFLLLLCLPGLAAAQTIRYVRPTATGNGSGTGWNNASSDLQAMINASTAGDQVWVAAGTYKPTTTTGPSSRTICFAMKEGIGIYGGFAGTESNLGQRPNVNPVTGSPSSSTLSGDIGVAGNNSDNSYHVISNASGLTTTAVLDGFVITGGNANSADNSGGGVYNNGTGSVCSPTFRNCLLQGNAALFGAAMYNNGFQGGVSSPLLTNCVLQNNTASTNGGAMYNDGSSGGQSMPVLTNCVLQANSAINGGAVYNIGLSGGVSSPVLTNCALQGNTASTSGGALYNNGNSGVSSPVLTNCALQGNTASTSGGALYNNGTSGGQSAPVLANSVLWGNGGSKSVSNTSTATTQLRYSLYELVSVTTGVDISGPGNLTTTTSPFVSTTSVALVTGSVAINAGSPSSVTAVAGPYSEIALPTTDLAGNARIVGGRVDMGAVEDQSPTLPARLYVKANATGANTGLSWADAFTDLQSALTYPNSQSLTEVWVAAGTYKPTTTTGPDSRTIAFVMRAGVAIYGGFAGTESNLSDRPSVNPVTGSPSSSTLSGDIGTVGDNSDNSNSVVRNNGNGLTSTARLDGFVITGGSVSGGIFNLSSSPAITNCLLQGNKTNSNGGGIANFSGSPTITNCVLQSNSAVNHGGGIYNSSSSPTITSCVLQSNTVGSNGGGLYNSNSNPVLTDCVLQRNSAFNGGAIYNLNSSPLLTNCSLESCTVVAYGGAMYTDGGSPALTSCVVQSNSANIGGGLYNTSSSPVLTNCSLLGNKSSGSGGAVFNQVSSNPVLTNCSLQSNSATQGAAVFNTASSGPVLTNCSLQGNFTFSGGGVIYNTSFSNPTITNCVFYGNPANVITNVNSTPTIRYTLFNAASFVSGPGNLTTATSPFVSTTSTELNGCALAIGTADPATTAGTVGTTDLAGNARFTNGRLDMGAYQYQGEVGDLVGAITVQPIAGTAVCTGTSVSVPVSATGTGTSFTYQWYKDDQSGTPLSLGAAQSSSALTLPTATTADAGTYRVVVSTACNSLTSTTFSLTVNAAPIVTVGSAVTLLNCVTTVITLTASSGTSYRWDNNVPTRTLNVNVARTYSVTVTAANGCTAVGQRTIGSDYTTPTVGLTATNVCAGQSVTLTATPGLVDYTFTTPTGTFISPVSNTRVVLGLAANTYSFTVVAYHPTSSCSASATAGATVSPLPTPTITASRGAGPPSSTLTCAQTSLTLTATGGSSYTFTGPSGGIVSQDQSNGTAVIGAAGTYTVIVANASGCTSTTTLTISSNTNPPAVSVSPTSATLTCAVPSVTLTASGSAATYRWADNSTASTLVVSTPGIYQVTATSANGCTAVSNDVVISQDNMAPTNPQLTASNSGTLTCAVTSLTLTASATGTGLSYAFTGPSGTLVGSGNTRVITTPGTYTVVVTGSNGCTAVATTTVQSNTTAPSNVSLTAAPSSTLTCAQTSLTLTASATGNGLSYIFNGPSGVVTGSGDTRTVSAPGVYTVIITGSNGCTAMATSTISQNGTLPTPTLTASNGGTLTCAQTSLTLTAGGGSGGPFSYAFAGLGIVSQNATAGTAVVNASGTYSVTVTNTATGCFSTTTTDVSSNTSAPTVSVSPTSATLTCAVTSVTLTASGSAATYHWADNSTASTLVVSTPGTYQVTATSANGCTAVSNNVVISQDNTAPTNPQLTASNSGTLTCSVTSLTLTASATGTGLTYVFTGPSDVLAGSGNTRVVSTPGTYTVTITGSNGCTATATTTVESNTSAPGNVNLTAAPSSMLTCAQTSLTLTATGGTSYTFTGPGGGIVSQDQTNGSAVVGTAGTYTVTVGNGTGCVSSTTIAVTSSTNNLPTILLPTTFTAIVGQFVQGEVLFTASGGAGNYTFGLSPLPPGLSVGLTSATQRRIDGTPQQTGVFPISVTVTDGNGCSAVSAPYALSVNCPNLAITLPTVATATVGVTIPNTITWSAAGSTGTYAFAFSPLPSGLSVTQSSAAFRALGGTITQAGTYPISLTVTDSYGCSAVSAPYALSVNCGNLAITLPTVTTATVGVTIPNTITWSAAGSTGTYTFAFSPLPSGLSVTGSGDAFRALGGSITQAGTYPISLTVTDSYGCSVVSAPYTLSVNCPSLSLTTPSYSTALTGIALPSPLAWQVSRGSSPYSFRFSSFPAGLVTNNVFSDYYDVRGTPTQSGTFPISVTVTDANGCSVTNGSYSLTTSCPTLAISTTTNLPSCTGTGSIAFTTTLPNGTYSLSYVGVGSPRSVVVSNGVFSLTGLSAGSYSSFSINYGSAACAPTVSSVVELTAPSAPSNVSLSPTPSSTLTCAQTSLTLTATATGEGLNYAFAGPSGTLVGSGNTRTINAPGTYTVVVTGANGCTATTTTAISQDIVTPTASLTSSTGSLSFCANSSLTLVAGGGVSYRFSSGAAQIGGNSDNTATVSTAGTYSVVVSGANGCTATASVSVSTVAVTTLTSVPPSSVSVCETAPVSLSVSASGVNLRYQWYKDANANPLSGQTSPTLSIATATIADNGSYYVTVMGTCGTTSTAPTTLTVRPRPAAPTLAPVSFIVTASPTPLPLTPFIVATSNTLSFSGVSGVLNPGVADISATGVQNFSVTATDQFGCVSLSTPFSLTVSLVSSPTAQSVCRGSAVELTVLPTAVRYQWFRVNGTALLRLTDVAGVQRGTGTSSLTLLSVQTSASYVCQATMANGSVVSYGPYGVTVTICGGNRVAAAEEPVAPLTVEVAPNPLVGDWLRAVVRGASGERLQVGLYDQQGRLWRQQVVERAADEQRIEWNVSGLPAGVLLLQATTGRHSQTIKVIHD